jgi:BolA protein
MSLASPVQGCPDDAPTPPMIQAGWGFCQLLLARPSIGRLTGGRRPLLFRGMTVADTIRRKLCDRFDPSRLEIVDESHRHAGHAGARPEGETHFAVTIVSAVFAGHSRVARQRLVYQTLAEELATRVHALSLTTLAPGERSP